MNVGEREDEDDSFIALLCDQQEEGLLAELKHLRESLRDVAHAVQQQQQFCADASLRVHAKEQELSLAQSRLANALAEAQSLRQSLKRHQEIADAHIDSLDTIAQLRSAVETAHAEMERREEIWKRREAEWTDRIASQAKDLEDAACQKEMTMQAAVREATEQHHAKCVELQQALDKKDRELWQFREASFAKDQQRQEELAKLRAELENASTARMGPKRARATAAAQPRAAVRIVAPLPNNLAGSSTPAPDRLRHNNPVNSNTSNINSSSSSSDRVLDVFDFV